jgi:fluoride exporter
MTWLLVALGGSIGALARFELGTWVGEHAKSRLPVGTLAVNTLGSFLAGLAWAADLTGTSATVVSTGFLGGFTTFSTWMVETGRLLEDDDRPGRGLANLGVMAVSGLLGVILGASIL